MDSIEKLTEDHQEVEELFEQIDDAADNPALQASLIDRLKAELTAHATLEEQHLYPALDQHPDLHALVSTARTEHNMIRDAMTGVMAARAGGERWVGLIRDLRNTVTAHVDREEDDLFPHAQSVLSEEQWQEIDAALRVGRERLNP